MSGQRNMAQRKATPKRRSTDFLSCESAKRLRGLSTVHPWTGAKLGAIHCAHPAGYPYVTSPPLRGPVHCASCAAKTKQISARFGFALAFPSPARREKVPTAIDRIDREQRMLARKVSTMNGANQADDDCMDAGGRGRSSASCAHGIRTSMCSTTQARLPRGF